MKGGFIQKEFCPLNLFCVAVALCSEGKLEALTDICAWEKRPNVNIKITSVYATIWEYASNMFRTKEMDYRWQRGLVVKLQNWDMSSVLGSATSQMNNTGQISSFLCISGFPSV